MMQPPPASSKPAVLDQMEALLQRHRPNAALGNAATPPILQEVAQDAVDELPVLTEVLMDDWLDAQPAPVEAPIASPVDESRPNGNGVGMRLDAAEYAELSRHLCDDIRHELQAAVSTMVKQKLTLQMAKFMQYATQKITKEVMHGLEPRIEEHVQRSLSDLSED